MDKKNDDFKNIGFMYIKSDYMLKKISDNLKICKLLNIIRYNKKLQKRLNKDINDYEINSSIKIEIIPKKNIVIFPSVFVNLYRLKQYPQIYFNDNYNKEIKRNFINEDDKISKITIIIDYEVNSLNQLFQECNCIEKINFRKRNNKKITDLSYMFYGCNSVKEINISDIYLKNLTNMR